MEDLISIMIEHSGKIWFIAGVILILFEFIIPGILVSFLGAGAILTSLLVLIWNPGFPTQLLFWAVTSLTLILIGSQFIKKIFPSKTEFVPPEMDYYNQTVTVEKKVLHNKKGGRVNFQGTHWDAVSMEKEIPKGKKARIISRDNLTFIVSPINHSHKQE